MQQLRSPDICRYIHHVTKMNTFLGWGQYTKTIELPDCKSILVQFASTKLFEMKLKKCLFSTSSLFTISSPHHLLHHCQKKMIMPCSMYVGLVTTQVWRTDIFWLSLEHGSYGQRRHYLSLGMIEATLIAIESVVKSEIVHSVLPSTCTDPISVRLFMNHWTIPLEESGRREY